MPESKEEKRLKGLLQRLVKGSTPTSDDIFLVAQSLVPSTVKSDRSLAYLCLSKICENISTDGVGSDGTDTGESVRAFVQKAFGLDTDEDTQTATYIPVTAFLAALVPLAPKLGTDLLTTPITPITVVASDSNTPEDSSNILAVLLEAAELPSPLQPILADLLAQASGTKPGRELVRAQAEDWLRGAIDYEQDQTGELGVLCAVALSKLHRDTAPEDQGIQVDENRQLAEDVMLVKKMMTHIKISTGTTTTKIGPTPTGSSTAISLLPTLEGLSLLSQKPAIRHVLITDPSFLSTLLALCPVPRQTQGSLPVTPRGSMDIDTKLFEPVDTSLCYGLTMILVNITARRNPMSAEELQIAKLGQMAISGKNGGEVGEDPFESDEAVRERVDVLVRTGVVGALRGLARAETRLVKEGIGRLCLNLVEEKTHRQVFIRDGGFRVLSNVVRDLANAASSNPKIAKESKINPAPGSATKIDQLPAIQALAKLVITTPPHLLFPPPHTTTCLNALTPLYVLVTHPSSTLLQQFEALMALTNLATIDPTISQRIITASITPPSQDAMWRGSGREEAAIPIMVKVQELLLDTNTLVRRAATELVCNLVASASGFMYFTGDDEIQKQDASTTDISPLTPRPSARVCSRLHILLALTAIDDLPTRLAAGGALALITESKIACLGVLTLSNDAGAPHRSSWHRVLSMLDPDPQPDDEDDDGNFMPTISTTPPDQGMVHRTVIILLNLVTFSISRGSGDGERDLKEARDAGVEERLLEIVHRQKGEDILGPAVECLKILKRYPA